MKLLDLLEGVEILACKVDLKCDVGEPCSDSRKIASNGVFIAIIGEKRNGNDYIYQVLERGGKCVITDSYEAYSANPNTILVRNTRLAEAHVWNNYYGRPTRDISIVAITGTNGKTSCAYYIYNILKASNKKRGLISTIECLINDEPYQINGGSGVIDISASMTTPDPEILYSIFNEMRKNGVQYIVMEASSHALEQFKLAPLKIEVGVFTNLSCEHLDFHKNMDEYYKAKKRLFEITENAIINIDDHYGKRLCEEININKITCSLNSANYVAHDISILDSGCSYKLTRDELTLSISSKTGGAFSVYNTMLSAITALSLGIDKRKIEEGILSTSYIKGRLERVGNERIFIDYAHTPNAIENALLTIRQAMPKGRLIALFGCGGDRDKSKRPKMAKIASSIADMIIITADNSRNESLIDIIADIMKGIPKKKSFAVIPQREDAIKFGLREMQGDDILVLLGKGHEEYEIDDKGKHYFSERKIIEEALRHDKNKGVQS